MKKLIAVVLLLCVLMMASCSNKTDTEAPEGTLKFENDIVDYTFFYPDTWRVASENGISSVEYTSANGHTAKVSVMAFDTDADSVNEYWETYQKDIVATFNVDPTPDESKPDTASDEIQQDTASDESEQDTASDKSEPYYKSEVKLDGVTALKVSYTASYGASENLYRFDQVICIRYGTVYIITFSSLNDDYVLYSSGMDKVITYFKFK